MLSKFYSTDKLTFFHSALCDSILFPTRNMVNIPIFVNPVDFTVYM